jgi:hypothetical protein
MMSGGRRTGGRLKTPDTPRTVELKVESFAVRLADRLEKLIPVEVVLLLALFVAFVVALITATVQLVHG